MIRFTSGNLLDSGAEALVNTVNTVGVMGKGIALMFKDAFPENFKAYEAACKTGEVQIGRMFATHRSDLYGPRWIVNFPTKKHWRHPSKLEWIADGLADLKALIVQHGIRSIAIPPLGAGNGGLEWQQVRSVIESGLSGLGGVDILVFEPVSKYQNVTKRFGAETLTPARALIAELVRRYEILGFACSVLEVQKLAWFAETRTADLGLENPLRLGFTANRYGPYSDRLRHLLNGLDGSYLHCDKRLADAGPFDTIWFDDAKRDIVATYFTAPEAKIYKPALEATAQVIDGFESPFGMELLATVDWLRRDGVPPTVSAMSQGMRNWPGGKESAERKQRLFDDRVLAVAIDRLEGRS